ncbi:MAG: C39 family peptidase [Flavobacterium sp.]
MIATKKKVRKQIDELQMDLEIINPIESKTILAGGWYDNGYGITITYGGGSSGGDYWYDSSGGSYASDWNNIDGNNGSGGGGGSDSAYVEVLLSNLPQYCPVQAYNGACVQTSASFVASLFGSIQSTEFMMHEYAVKNNMSQIQEVNALFQGLGHDQQVAFLLQQFNMTGVSTISEMTNAIDKGHPVMGVIMSGANSGHEVTIVGYDNATQNFTIANTLYGGYSYASYTDINTNIQSWEITGVKP